MCRVEAAWTEGDLSPELVLVDPDLAEAVRAQPPEKVDPTRSNAKPDCAPLPVSDWEAALRRIAEHSNNDEFDEPSPRYHMPKVRIGNGDVDAGRLPQLRYEALRLVDVDSVSRLRLAASA